MITISLTPALVHLICHHVHLTDPPVSDFFHGHQIFIPHYQKCPFYCHQLLSYDPYFPPYSIPFLFQLNMIPVSLPPLLGLSCSEIITSQKATMVTSSNQVITPSIKQSELLSVIFLESVKMFLRMCAIGNYNCLVLISMITNISYCDG